MKGGATLLKAQYFSTMSTLSFIAVNKYAEHGQFLQIFASWVTSVICSMSTSSAKCTYLFILYVHISTCINQNPSHFNKAPVYSIMQRRPPLQVSISS